MARFAAETSVGSEQSRMEIERTLKRYGADAFMYASDAGKAMIAFRAKGRQIRFLLPLPDPQGKEFSYTPVKRQLQNLLLQGLPEDFFNNAPFSRQGKQEMLGNGVPLPMGRALARAVRRAIDG